MGKFGNGEPAVVDDSLCPGVKPPTEQHCKLQIDCEVGTFHWVTSVWSECPVECGGAARGGTQNREVKCRDHMLNDAPVASCPTPAPPATQECNTISCETNTVLEPYTWQSCDWEACTAECGGSGTTGGVMAGTLDRQVFCESTATQKRVPDEACANVGARPTSQKIGCNPEPCSAVNWMTTPWSSCVNGERHRTSHCHAADGGNAPGKCPAAQKPTSKEACQSGVCPEWKNGRPDPTGGPDGNSPDGSPGGGSSSARGLVASYSLIAMLIAAVLRV